MQIAGPWRSPTITKIDNPTPAPSQARAQAQPGARPNPKKE
jgi:hypothetical protein